MDMRLAVYVVRGGECLNDGRDDEMELLFSRRGNGRGAVWGDVLSRGPLCSTVFLLSDEIRDWLDTQHDPGTRALSAQVRMMCDDAKQTIYTATPVGWGGGGVRDWGETDARSHRVLAF